VSRPPLLVRLNGRPVAELIDAGGMCGLTYLPEVAAINPGAYLLSVRLPVRKEPYAATQGPQAFLDGLLPEGWMRDQLASNARINRDDTYAMLARYGGDCAGAVSITDPDTQPSTPGVRWLNAAEPTETIRHLRFAPLGDGTDVTVRLSLGGMQEKLVAVIEEGKVGIPTGDHPSTHILKPSPLEPDGSERYAGIAVIEHLCISLAGRMADVDGHRIDGIGFAAPRTDLIRIADREVLVVERFDRTIVDGELQRLHTEDGCQILGLAPTVKYEQGGNPRTPSLARIATMVRDVGADPALDLRALLQQVAFTVCVGNADLHARNLTVLHDRGVRLAPMYDVAVTVSFSDVNRELGLRIGGAYHLDDVTGGHLLAEAATWKIGAKSARRAVETCCESVRAHVDEVADKIRDAGHTSDAFERSVQEIHRRTSHLATSLD